MLGLCAMTAPHVWDGPTACLAPATVGLTRAAVTSPTRSPARRSLPGRFEAHARKLKETCLRQVHVAELEPTLTTRQRLRRRGCLQMSKNTRQQLG